MQKNRAVTAVMLDKDTDKNFSISGTIKKKKVRSLPLLIDWSLMFI